MGENASFSSKLIYSMCIFDLEYIKAEYKIMKIIYFISKPFHLAYFNLVSFFFSASKQSLYGGYRVVLKTAAYIVCFFSLYKRNISCLQFDGWAKKLNETIKTTKTKIGIVINRQDLASKVSLVLL
jgi:hypothetical protein